MVMVGQHRRLAEPLHLGRREVMILAGVGACMAVAVAVLAVFAIAQGGVHTRAGCIQATTASYVGGGQVRACGADARQLCRSVASSAPGTPQGEVAAACRRARISVTH